MYVYGAYFRPAQASCCYVRTYITHTFSVRTYIMYVEPVVLEMEKSARKIWKMKGNQENNFNRTQEQRATLYA